ncbi:hypothetical protein LTR85_011987 [Meristemomyces frigidus]|nr:hypothetical protein LTR85_011987 [Meristemomyces frigidus]
MADHHDFAVPWCQKLLSDPSIQWTHDVSNHLADGTVSNSMFNKTLYNSRAIEAHLSFRRDALDGKHGRAHGGFNALILDQITGTCAQYTAPGADPPTTATLTVDYKAPINTPCIVLARAWAIEITGRKIWLRGVIEDRDGKALASGKALFICPRPSAL